MSERQVKAINHVLNLAGGSYAVALASLVKRHWQVIDLKTAQRLALLVM